LDETLFRFGDGGALFGAYHPPLHGAGAEAAVLFCPPFAEEKKCSYRTFVRAARAFAAAGVACVRFDYFGTGDSEGDFRQFSPRRATDDVTAAAAKARELSGASRTLLLGLRLGGTLALAAAPRAGAHRVILWQPVLDGAAFFNRTIQRQMLRKQLIGGPGAAPADNDAVIDLDGFPLSRAAADEIRSLDALALADAFAGPVSLLQISHNETPSRESRRLIDALGDRLTFTVVRCEPFWNRIDLADTTPVIERTVSWLKG